MDIEPLPKVTFLPAQLTELVIKNWTGDVIDYEKNGQVSINDPRILKEIHQFHLKFKSEPIRAWLFSNFFLKYLN